MAESPLWCLGAVPGMLSQPARREDLSLLAGCTLPTNTLVSIPAGVCPVAVLGTGSWLCWGCLPAAGSHEPGVCFLPGSGSGGCRASRKEIVIAVFALLPRLGAAPWLLPARSSSRQQHRPHPGLTGEWLNPPGDRGAARGLAGTRSGPSPQPQPGGSRGPARTGPAGGGAGARPGRGSALPGPQRRQAPAAGPGDRPRRRPTPRPRRGPPALPAPGLEAAGRVPAGRSAPSSRWRGKGPVPKPHR